MAGGIDWFRWYHGSVTDPKFSLVARKSGASLPDVLAVWAFLLEAASSAEQRGNFGRIDCESVDCLFGFPSTEERTLAVLKAMHERELIDLGSNTATAWAKRQPKRERPEDSSAERVRAYRDRQRVTDDVTPSNATQHQETPRGEESRAEHTEHKHQEQKQGHVQPTAARATPTAARFDEFWSAYPVRKGKAAALGKWKLKRLDDIADTILADVAKRKTQDRDWVEGYAPHASTYVNQRGWEDDIKPINGGNHATSTLSGKPSLADRAAKLMLERRQQREAEAEAAIVGHGPGRVLAHDA